MAKFLGSVEGGRGEATRLGHKFLRTTAASWHGAVDVQLTEDKNGNIIAHVSLKPWRGSGVHKDIWSGRVDGSDT